jgi:N-acetylglucosaminyldiphosphoundecaprenol N-acetyl-beta-D-mannosaminyltransferase
MDLALLGPASKTAVLGIPVSSAGVGDIEQLLHERKAGESLTITFVNPLACSLDEQHPDYTTLLKDFDIVTCDGIGMVKAAQSSGLTDVKRESFDYTSLAESVFAWAEKNEVEIGLVGGEADVTQKAATVLRGKFPELKIAACFSGFIPDPDLATEFFTENQTELVICGMGSPLQERFILNLVKGGWSGIGFTCGGFLDQVIVGEAYYPHLVDRLNIRFLYRLFKEPRRLWRRYLVEYQVFLKRYGRLQWNLLKAKMGLTSSLSEK